MAVPSREVGARYCAPVLKKGEVFLPGGVLGGINSYVVRLVPFLVSNACIMVGVCFSAPKRPSPPAADRGATRRNFGLQPQLVPKV